jgi:Cu(I)/Ag(I) efflux system periplasmic protein CusF
MKHLALAGLTILMTVSLAACGKKGESPPPAPVAAEATPTATNAASMANMDMAGAKMAKGTGTVTAVDAAAGTITLDHGPIPEAGWPAMTMAFKAGPSVTGAVKTGDKVDFDLKLQGGAGEVTAVSKK